MPNGDTLTILIHGFTRGAADMQFWKQVLLPEFPHILTPDLPTTYGSLQLILYMEYFLQITFFF